jgi:hypothetical protein
MSDNYNDENELDRAFRQGIEGHRKEPPPRVWAGVRAAALEQSLFTAQRTALWFKGIAAGLAILLGGVSYLLYQKNNEDLVADNFITKTDTVYVYKTLPPKQSTIEQNSTTIPDEDYLKQLVWQNTQLRKQVRGLKKESFSASILDERVQILEKEKFDLRNQLFEEQSKRLQKNDDVVANNQTLQKQEKLLAKGISISPLPKAGLSPNAKIPDPEPVVWVSPSIWERIYVSGYISPEANGLSVRRNTPRAFDYANQSIGSSFTAGLRLGIQLNDNWQVYSGIELGSASFGNDERDRKGFVINAEPYNGRPAFLYQTALGIVEIPNKGGSPTRNGEPIGVRVANNTLEMSYIRIPLGVRYDFWRKEYEKSNKVLRIYGLTGGTLTIPQSQTVTLDVQTLDGRRYDQSYSQFDNTQAALGLNFGMGAELSIAKRWRVMLEPSFTQNVSSIVRDLPYNSMTNSFGVKMGLSWTLWE